MGRHCFRWWCEQDDIGMVVERGTDFSSMRGSYSMLGPLGRLKSQLERTHLYLGVLQTVVLACFSSDLGWSHPWALLYSVPSIIMCNHFLRQIDT